MFDTLLNNQGIALAVIGYFGFILKDMPERIWAVIKQRYSATIQVTSDIHDIFDACHQWVLSLYPQLESHSQAIRYDVSSRTSNAYIVDGIYWIPLDWCTFAIVRCNMLENKNFVTKQIVVTIIGKQRQKYLKQYKEYVWQHCLALHVNDLRVYVNNSQGRSCNFVAIKSFEDIFFAQKQVIINFLDNFLANKKIYVEHGVAYKTGILLYGLPGSGKSTIARAIASYLGWNIEIVDVRTMFSLPYLVDKCVVLIEDIDCLVGQRQTEVKNTKEEVGLLSIHALLNYLDGVNSPQNCVFVATTNYIDRVDKALIRPGRFDMCVEVPYADETMCQCICDRYGVEYGILQGIQFPVSPAVVQNRIIQRINGVRKDIGYEE